MVQLMGTLDPGKLGFLRSVGDGREVWGWNPGWKSPRTLYLRGYGSDWRITSIKMGLQEML